MEKKELDCVVSPVESYEDVTNIPLGDSHNQEEDPISFSGIYVTKVCASHKCTCNPCLLRR